MVQCGFGCSLLFRIHYTHVIFGCSCLLVHLVAGRESKMEIGLGLQTAILFVFLGLYIVTCYFCFPVCKETSW